MNVLNSLVDTADKLFNELSYNLDKIAILLL